MENFKSLIKYRQFSTCVSQYLYDKLPTCLKYAESIYRKHKMCMKHKSMHTQASASQKNEMLPLCNYQVNNLCDVVKCLYVHFCSNISHFTSLVAVSVRLKVYKKKKQPAHKHVSTDFEVKLRMTQKYEDWKSLSSISHKLSFTVSTVTTTVKDTACN